MQTYANEILTRRNYNSKTYPHPTLSGQFITTIAAGNIHYKDKFGSGTFKDVDHTLIWNGSTGWTFTTHNYQPFIPLYADQTATFRDVYQGKDQTVSYTPVCSHVAGRLVLASNLAADNLSAQTSANCVIYDNAFGTGIDLIYCFNLRGMTKLIRIKSTAYPSVDTQFTFAISFPANAYRAKTPANVTSTVTAGNVKSTASLGVGATVPTVETTAVAANATMNAYLITPGQAASFNSPWLIFSGVDAKDGQEWYTWIDSFKIWEQLTTGNSLAQIIPVSYTTDGKIVKNIPASFFTGRTGDVFTDASTNVNGSNSFRAYCNDQNPPVNTWAQVIAGTSGTLTFYADQPNDMRTEWRYLATDHHIVRGGCTFVKSGLPVGIVTAATVTYIGSFATASDPLQLTGLYGMGAYTTVPTTTNATYILFNGTTQSNTTIQQTAATTAVNWPLNAARLSALGGLTNGSYYCGVRNVTYDAGGTTPGSDPGYYPTLWFMPSSDATYYPYLTITYTPQSLLPLLLMEEEGLI